eukprot:gb/GEZN01017427.1/.p1 GENE.gb/GEZN01017427.1/~~gb/GEZN01017427.1/.p1  ORF type:complete len:178 (+),score=40.42 gb/GEZN01017427.1/:196-729(+)
MDHWAQKYGQQVHFICIGCAGKTQAKMMRDRMSLKHCTTGFVADKSHMPRWGQLGCNGFIVLDKELGIISAATAPFNMVRGLGFSHVEVLLGALLNQKPVPPVCPGQFLRLKKLQSSAALNGELGVCVGPPTNERFPVQLLKSGRQLSIKAGNLRVVQNTEAEHEEQDSGEADVYKS